MTGKEDSPKYNIEEAAKRLGRRICGRVPHVVEVTLLRKDPHVPGLELYVSIDTDDVPKRIPKKSYGYPVHVRRVGTPEMEESGERPTQVFPPPPQSQK